MEEKMGSTFRTDVSNIISEIKDPAAQKALNLLLDKAVTLETELNALKGKSRELDSRTGGMRKYGSK